MHIRVFLSPDNAFGFGLADFIELAVAVLSIALLLGHARLRPWFSKLAQRSGWSFLLLAALPIALRLVLLPRYPVPVPSGSDDFGYLLLADTLRHFRLANPPHPLPQFFQQIFVLQRPTHSSMYPLGQGLLLALGWAIFGLPWAGVLLSVGIMCALCYWMLRGWTTPEWALAGGLLAVMEFGPLCYWINCYWGGAVSAAAGCLVFGALPRLQTRPGIWNAALLGLGLGLQLLTRPYEFILLVLSLLLFLLPVFARWRSYIKVFLIAMLPLAAAGGLCLAQNKAVTGKWTTLPYLLYRYQYGVPTTFTFQSNPIPHQNLNAEQALDYRAESIIHGEGRETVTRYLERLIFRVRFLRFFVYAPLYLALVAFLVRCREYRLRCVLLTILIFSLGSNFFPYFYPHYIAAITCLFVLACVTGLQWLNNATIRGKWKLKPAGTLLVLLCTGQFLFWYGARAIGSDNFLASAGQFESWDFINRGDPQGRIAINRQLAAQPGKQLVFVRYAAGHMFHEWVQNNADIDASHIVWAHDLGYEENKELLHYYPNRKVWLLEPDQVPPRLTPYTTQSSPFENVE